MKAGWKTVKLGEVARYDKAQGVHSGLPYVGLEHIESGTRKHIGPRIDTEVQSSTFLFNPNHVLYGRLRPYLRKVLVPDFAGHCSTEIFPVLPSSELDRSFLSYWLISESTTTAIDRLCNGARMPRANMEQALELEIPLPPLAEQKRIVALLDEAFAGIDEAKAKIDRCSENVESILQVFVDENFGSFAETCPPRPLKDVSEYFNGLTYAPQDVSDSGTIVLRSSNVQEGNLDLSDRVRVSARIKDKLYARAGDVLMCSRNGSKRLIGKCTLIPAELPERMTFGTFMMIIRSDIGPFLNLFFKSSRFKAQIASGSATNINQITRGMLDDVELPMPDNTASIAFVTKAAELSGLVNEYVTRLSQRSRLLDEIKSSLLAQAFAGELTA